MILCFGEALVDLYALPLHRGVASAASFTPRFGGAPANVAVALGRLGVATRFAGAVGRDGHGERLLAVLRRAGVDLRAVEQRADRTGITFVSARGNSRSFLFYRAGGADYSPDLDLLRSSCPTEGVRWILLGSSAFVTPQLAACASYLLDEAARLDLRVAVDLNVRPHLWRDARSLHAAADRLLEVADIVKASDDDLRALGLPGSIGALAARANRDALVALTRGRAGWEAALGPRRWRGEADEVAARDATGAGDAFTAGLLAGLCDCAWSDDRVGLALRAAGSLGAKAVTKVGAVEAMRPPWPQSVRVMLRARESQR